MTTVSARGGTRRRAVFAAVLVLAGACWLAPWAAGAPTVVVDSTAVTLATNADGTHAASITVANLGARSINVTGGIPGDAGCSVTAAPPAVPPGPPTKVTLTLGTGCETRHGADVKLHFAPNATPKRYLLEAAPGPPSLRPHWAIVLWSFLIALGFAAALVRALL